MAGKKMLVKDQESLADVLFPTEDEFEEAILSIPPEKRVLRTEHYDFSVSTLVAMMDKSEVVIPEYQRRYVWTDRQASRLIESLIIQCPIPVIYLNQEKDETFAVIDGNQRLNSLKRFLEDTYTLVGLTSYPELSGLKYSQLDKRFQRHISNRVLRCTVILKETHPQVKFDVFERLNSGAVQLTRQELRHGLYYGKLLKAAGLLAKELQRNYGDTLLFTRFSGITVTLYYLHDFRLGLCYAHVSAPTNHRTRHSPPCDATWEQAPADIHGRRRLCALQRLASPGVSIKRRGSLVLLPDAEPCSLDSRAF
jgi:hypothetical protein